MRMPRGFAKEQRRLAEELRKAALGIQILQSANSNLDDIQKQVVSVETSLSNKMDILGIQLSELDSGLHTAMRRLKQDFRDMQEDVLRFLSKIPGSAQPQHRTPTLLSAPTQPHFQQQPPILTHPPSRVQIRPINAPPPTKAVASHSGLPLNARQPQ